jgi:hypothetical protein
MTETASPWPIEIEYQLSDTRFDFPTIIEMRETRISKPPRKTTTIKVAHAPPTVGRLIEISDDGPDAELEKTDNHIATKTTLLR